LESRIPATSDTPIMEEFGALRVSDTEPSSEYIFSTFLQCIVETSCQNPNNLSRLAGSLVERLNPDQEDMSSNPRRDRTLQAKKKVERFSTTCVILAVSRLGKEPNSYSVKKIKRFL
jgi:hypothetical protein